MQHSKADMAGTPSAGHVSPVGCFSGMTVVTMMCCSMVLIGRRLQEGETSRVGIRMVEDAEVLQHPDRQ